MSKDFGNIEMQENFKIGLSSSLYISCDDDIIYPKDYVKSKRKIALL